MPVSRHAVAPSYFHYAKDILVITKGMARNAENVVVAFKLYEELSSQQLNWEKSNLFMGSFISSARQRHLIQVAGMRIGFFLICLSWSSPISGSTFSFKCSSNCR